MPPILAILGLVLTIVRALLEIARYIEEHPELTGKAKAKVAELRSSLERAEHTVTTWRDEEPQAP